MSRASRIVKCVLVLSWLQLCWSIPSFASDNHNPTVASICESAAQIASVESNVPLDVLRSISLTETGRKKQGVLRPWPWTVNIEGIGKWFDTFDAAQDYVERHYDRGARSFDVGCFQINYRWHGQNFTSIEAMFDPTTNARYAARFLGELYEEFGDWSKAAGAYHSRSPKFAKKYRARFDRILANLPDVSTMSLAPVPSAILQQKPSEPRQNNFPLLQSSGQSASIASLVLIEESGRRLIDLQGVTSLMDN